MTWTTPLTEENVDRWAVDPEVLQLGSTGWQVEIFEQLCEALGPDLYLGRPDEDYGKGCHDACIQFQHIRMLHLEDGEAGPRETKPAMAEAWRVGWKVGQPYSYTFPNRATALVYGPCHPQLGDIPGAVLGGMEIGKVSHFGGPYDPGDRCEGQGLIVGGTGSPREFLRHHRDLVQLGVLMTEEQAATVKATDRRGRPLGYPYFCGEHEGAMEVDLDTWPWTTDWRGRRRRAGSSSCLNQDGFYIALPFRASQRRFLRRTNRVRVVCWSEETGKAASSYPSDVGPARFTGKNQDYSKGMIGHLGLRTGQRGRYCWGAEELPLGPIE